MNGLVYEAPHRGIKPRNPARTVRDTTLIPRIQRLTLKGGISVDDTSALLPGNPKTCISNGRASRAAPRTLTKPSLDIGRRVTPFWTLTPSPRPRRILIPTLRHRVRPDDSATAARSSRQCRNLAIRHVVHTPQAVVHSRPDRHHEADHNPQGRLVQGQYRPHLILRRCLQVATDQDPPG